MIAFAPFSKGSRLRLTCPASYSIDNRRETGSGLMTTVTLEHRKLSGVLAGLQLHCSCCAAGSTTQRSWTSTNDLDTSAPLEFLLQFK